MDDKARKVLSSLQAQCARREYCIGDMRRKALTRLEGDAAAAEELIASLVEDGFIDESRYCAAFVSEKSSLTGWGPVKIRRALSLKNIPRETIETALQEADSDKADAKLEKLLRSKWKSLYDDPQGKLKLLRFALSRGYEYEQIRTLADSITSESA